MSSEPRSEIETVKAEYQTSGQYEVEITETGRQHTRDEAYIISKSVNTFDTIKEVQEHLKERYGRIPNGRNKIYVDTPTQNGSIVIGFLYSYWNTDISHYNGSQWFQTDWIVISYVRRSISPEFVKEVLS